MDSKGMMTGRSCKHVLFMLTIYIALFAVYSPLYAHKETFPLYKKRVAGGTIYYYKVGVGAKKVLMLHGLFATSNQWFYVLKQMLSVDPLLSRRYTFIFPDLPGFGKSQGYPFAVYNLKAEHKKALSQLSVLNQFIKQFKFKNKINIVGNSMGGGIAALYTMQYPEEIKTLAFLGSPEGVTDFAKPFVDLGIKKGFNPFIPTTFSQFNTEMYLLTPDFKHFTPKKEIVEKYVLPKNKREYIQRTAIYNTTNLPENMHALQHHLAITQACLIMWGDKDYIFGQPSHAYELSANLSKARYREVVVVHDAGHLILLSKQSVLNQMAHTYITFLDKFND